MDPFVSNFTVYLTGPVNECFTANPIDFLQNRTDIYINATYGNEVTV
jgi:hypothetical protein